MAAVHSQHNAPRSFQLVSSACLTAAACTAAIASWWGAAKAALTSCSRLATVPSASGASKTSAAISSTPRLLTP